MPRNLESAQNKCDHRLFRRFEAQCSRLSAIYIFLGFLSLVPGARILGAIDTYYEVTDLGAPAVYARSFAFSVNVFGQTTGASAGVLPFFYDGEPYFYDGERKVPLNTGRFPGVGWGVNDRGQVVGSLTYPHGVADAFVSTDGKVADLGTLGGVKSFAYAINNFGAITGNSFTTQNAAHAFLLANGTLLDLGTLGGSFSQGVALNDHEEVVGSFLAQFPTAYHAFFFSHGKMQDLGNLGGDGATAWGINNAGQVVGGADTPHGTHAFLYSAGVMADLGTLGTGGFSEANGINNSGDATGIGSVGESSHAFLYRGDRLEELNDFIPPNSHWFLEIGYAINDRGQVLGTGSFHFKPHVFLLSPQFTWGAHVRVLFSSGQMDENFLVAFDGATAFFQRDLRVGRDGEVQILGSGVPLSEIQKITLVTSRRTPSLANSEDGFNKYIADGALSTISSSGTVRTISLGDSSSKDVAYDGTWHWSINSLGLKDDRIAQDAPTLAGFWAIPRPVLRNATSARRDPVAESGLSARIVHAAHDAEIPPQILQAIAWHESTGPGRFAHMGWNQSGFLGVGSTPNHAVNKVDTGGYEATVVTYDGRIGMMQITAATALTGAPITLPERLTYLFKLAADLDYNVSEGAAILSEKWDAAVGLGATIGEASPEIASFSKKFLEHWYPAIWLYNGPESKPIRGRNIVYPNIIWNLLQRESPGNRGSHLRWALLDFPKSTLCTYYIADPDKPRLYTFRKSPQPSFNDSVEAVHADVDGDGSVDVELAHPVARSLALEDEISIEARPRLSLPAASIVSVTATILHADGTRSSELSLSIQSDGVTFLGTLPSRLQDSETVSFGVTCSTSNGQNTAKGATFAPNLPLPSTP